MQDVQMDTFSVEVYEDDEDLQEQSEHHIEIDRESDSSSELERKRNQIAQYLR